MDIERYSIKFAKMYVNSKLPNHKIFVIMLSMLFESLCLPKLWDIYVCVWGISYVYILIHLKHYKVFLSNKHFSIYIRFVLAAWSIWMISLFKWLSRLTFSHIYFLVYWKWPSNIFFHQKIWTLWFSVVYVFLIFHSVSFIDLNTDLNFRLNMNLYYSFCYFSNHPLHPSSSNKNLFVCFSFTIFLFSFV